jgi:hypothetical protein
LKNASPLTVSGKIGRKATLNCAADAVPVPLFRWYKNGYEVFENIVTFSDVSRHTVKASSMLVNFDASICLF